MEMLAREERVAARDLAHQRASAGRLHQLVEGGRELLADRIVLGTRANPPARLGSGEIDADAGAVVVGRYGEAATQAAVGGLHRLVEAVRERLQALPELGRRPPPGRSQRRERAQPASRGGSVEAAQDVV